MRTVWYDGYGTESATPFIFIQKELHPWNGPTWAMVAYCSQIDGYASTGQSVSKFEDIYYPGAGVPPITGYDGMGWYRGYKGYKYYISIRRYYDINFRTSDPSAGSVSINGGEYRENTKVDVTAQPKDGYKFSYWDDGDENAERTVTAVADRTYVAYFEKLPITFTVVFDPGGGTGSEMSNQTFTVGVSQKLKKNTYSRTGYEFIGWKVKDKEDDIYKDEAEGSNISNTRGDTVTLIAQWRRVYFDVTIENSRTDTGTLSLLFAGNVVATESGGVLSYEGKSGVTYEIACELKNRLYAPLGVNIGGKYVSSFRPDEDESLSLTYEYQKKPTYAISLNFDSSKGEVAINTPSAETVYETEKWIGGDKVEISISPKSESGWKFKIANVIDSDNISRGSYKELSGGKISLIVGFDMTVQVEFERARYIYRAEIDDPSAVAIERVIASTSAASPDGKVEHGETVTFTAFVAEGYSFAGWYYKDNPDPMSLERSYSRAIDRDLVLTAKAKVAVELSVETEEGKEKENDPVLRVNGENCEGNSYADEVVLGESIYYKLDRGDWHLDSWYSGIEPVSIPLEGVLTPDAPIKLVAKFKAEKVQRILTVVAIRTKDGAMIEQEEVIRSTVAPTPSGGHGGFLGGIIPSNVYEFKFEGTSYVSVRADAKVDGSLGFNFFAAKLTPQNTPDVTSILSRMNEYVFLLNKNVTIYACYGDYEKVDTKFTFATGSDRTMGEIIVDSMMPDVDGSVIVNQLQQTEIVAKAYPRNGYEFVGWYENAECIGEPFSMSVEQVFVVTSQRTIYAAFEKNPHAIYEWEGSRTNKMMEWRSKVYAAPVPFNPSAARVDARGYGVALEVGMYSSPDGNPTRKAEIVMKNQDARRLPTLRPERYMQICVKNDAEVDAVIVSTSMKGLAV